MTTIAAASPPPVIDRHQVGEVPTGGDTTAGPTIAPALPHLLAPRSVAVVGTADRRDDSAHEILRTMYDYGFQGRLYAVNHSGHPMCGLPAYRCVTQLPEPVDLLLLTPPRDQLGDVLADAGCRGAYTGAVIGGPAGPLPAAVARLARRDGIALAGPHSLGVINTDPMIRLNACLAPIRPAAGGLAVAARSEAIGVALLEEAVRTGCGISNFVSLGRTEDIHGPDLVAHWFADPATRAIALQLDSPADLYRTAHISRALGRRKPVLVIGGGPDADGASTATAGIIVFRSVGELVDAARILADQPPPAGDRLAIIGNAGELTTLAAGAATAAGFVHPAGGGRPVDLDMHTAPARLVEAAGLIADSGAADLLLVMVVGSRANAPEAILAGLGRVIDDHPNLTVAAVVINGSDDPPRLGDRVVPVYREPERAVRALARAHDYAMHRPVRF